MFWYEGQVAVLLYKMGWLFEFLNLKSYIFIIITVMKTSERRTNSIEIKLKPENKGKELITKRKSE